MVSHSDIESENRVLRTLKNRLKRYPTLVALHRLTKSRALLSDWWYTQFSKRMKVVLLPAGFKLVSRNYAANRAMLSGAFEVEETEILRHQLDAADVFIDVGANIGLYTFIARSKGKYAVAIEPQPHNLECLYAGLSLNGWTDTEVYPLGLSDKYGLVSLYGASGTGASLLSGWAAYSSRFRQTISVTTLDTLLSNRFDGKKLLIKIDVEGAEFGVLRGAEKTLRMSPRPAWMIEICLNEFHPTGLNPDYAATFEMFWTLGYQARTADRQRTLIEPADLRDWIAAKRSSLGVFNYIFTYDKD